MAICSRNLESKHLIPQHHHLFAPAEAYVVEKEGENHDKLQSGRKVTGVIQIQPVIKAKSQSLNRLNPELRVGKVAGSVPPAPAY